eukprot:104047_1
MSLVASPNDNNENKESKTSDMSKAKYFNVIMIGGSGSVGQTLVNQLIQSPKCQSIHLLNRKEIGAFVKQPKVTQYTVNMSELQSETSQILKNIKNQIEVGYITMGVGAPSKSDEKTLEKVDVLLPTEFAKAIHQFGISHIALLSSVGADITAEKNWLGTSAGGGLYNHYKGQIEHNLSEMGFQSVGLFRPSALYGSKNTPKYVENLMPKIHWAISKKYHGIQITDLAAAMIAHTEHCLCDNIKQSRIDILEGDSLFKWIPKT